LAWPRRLRWPVDQAVPNGELCSGDGAEGIDAILLASPGWRPRDSLLRTDAIASQRRCVMRTIVSAAFVSLDGVMQAPGGPDEDPSGGFEYGGWLAPFMDETITAAVTELLITTPCDLLLGRKTYDIFAAFWPFAGESADELDRAISKRFDAATKYVATHRPETLTWKNSQALRANVVASLLELKQQNGPPLVTQGSSALLQTLLANDLIDEIRLFVFPLTLGPGKPFFGAGTQPRTFELASSTLAPRGGIITTYRRAGAVTTGSLAKGELRDRLARRKTA
jgi:dihydrofolate reductase